MNARWLMLACALAGCDKLFSLDHIADAGAAGDASDATAISDAALCVGQTGGLLRVCFATLPPAMLDLSAAIDTDTDTRCVVQSGICVLAAIDLMVTGDVRASGTRPLALVATDRITITTAGIVDVSSHTTTMGAGAATCASPAGAQQSASLPGAGGAGGSFGDVGGNGGAVSGAAIASPTQPITSVRGGCAGGAGGGDLQVQMGGAGGMGGAIAMIAGNQIAIQGQVAADGAGGAGGNGGVVGSSYEGAGGGGSGGLIALDAPLIIVDSDAILIANGGGGGEGESPAGDGEAGFDPDLQVPDNRAQGGAEFGGGSGGAGSAGGGETIGLPGTQFNNRGGGGGGGGAGIILVTPAMPLLGQIDPPPT